MLLGVALLLTSGSVRIVVTALAALLFVGFAGVVALAIRKGLTCGCFGSFSDGPAGGSEAGRALALALIAVGLALSRPESFTLDFSTVLAAIGFGAVTIAAMAIGRVIVPSAPSRSVTTAGPRVALRTFVGGVSNNHASLPLPRPTERRTLAADDVAQHAAVLRDAPAVRSVVTDLAASGATPEWSQARGTQCFEQVPTRCSRHQ